MLESRNGSKEWRRKEWLILIFCTTGLLTRLEQDSMKINRTGPESRPTQAHNLKVIPKMLRSFTTFAALICLTSTVIAHEGHGHPEHQQGATHYLVNPSHALPILLLASAIVVIGMLISRTVKKWRS
jgi:hypothetical protein